MEHRTCTLSSGAETVWPPFGQSLAYFHFCHAPVDPNHFGPVLELHDAVLAATEKALAGIQAGDPCCKEV